MDRYTKLVLTVIAGALVVIALKPLELTSAEASLFSAASPTWGDWTDAIKSHDRQKVDDVRRRTPLVHVSDGNIEVTGSVQIER